MNRLLGMPEVKRLLGAPHLANRYVRDRLRAIADKRGVEGLQLVKLQSRWFTTEEDLRRLLPELFEHEKADADSLRSLVERQAVELRELRRKVEQLENTAFRHRTKA